MQPLKPDEHRFIVVLRKQTYTELKILATMRNMSMSTLVRGLVMRELEEAKRGKYDDVRRTEAILQGTPTIDESGVDEDESIGSND